MNGKAKITLLAAVCIAAAAILLSIYGRNGQAQSAPEAADCPKFASGRRVGRIASPEIREASGLVASAKNPGVLWTHNDSGDKARVFAVSIDGRLLGAYVLDGVNSRDAEDMAAGGAFLYLADIGDNRERREDIRLYRFKEPAVSPAAQAAETKVGEVDTIVLRYPRKAYDCETLLYDPIRKTLYLVTKGRTGEVFVFEVRPQAEPEKATILKQVASLPLSDTGIPGANLITSGTVSADGRLVILRTYVTAYVYRRDPGRPLYTAFDAPPCLLPLKSEPQGESIAFDAAGKGYFTLSEGKHQPIYYFGRLKD